MDVNDCHCLNKSRLFKIIVANDSTQVIYTTSLNFPMSTFQGEQTVLSPLRGSDFVASI